MKQVLILLAVLAFFVVAAALQAQPTCTLQGTVLNSTEGSMPKPEAIFGVPVCVNFNDSSYG